MSNISNPIDGDLAKSLSQKSDDELIHILEKADLWRSEVIDFAKLELKRRSVSTAQIEQSLAEKSKRREEELEKRSSIPLTFWESVFTALYGAGLGLLGLLFVWPQASRFESDGYILKSEKSWRLYWFAFGLRAAVIIIAIIIGVGISHRK